MDLVSSSVLNKNSAFFSISVKFWSRLDFLKLIVMYYVVHNIVMLILSFNYVPV